MCDTPILPCQVCGKLLPVHIGDFCTARANIGVRCGRHKPPRGQGWVRFRRCWNGEYWWWFPQIAGGSITKRRFTMYLRYIGPPEELEEGYGIGDAGDITPNCSEYEEAPCIT